MSAKCYLCVSHVWDKDRNVPVFNGYRLFSAAPWDLGGGPTVEAAILTTRAGSYDAAQKLMLDSVEHLASLGMPLWVAAWAWIDPSLGAHRARLELMEAAQRDARVRGVAAKALERYPCSNARGGVGRCGECVLCELREALGAGRGRTINDSDREDYVRNEESLYNWWRREMGGEHKLRAFVRANRAAIDAVIRGDEVWVGSTRLRIEEKQPKRSRRYFDSDGEETSGRD